MFTDKYLMPLLNETLLRGTSKNIIYSIIDGSENCRRVKLDFMLDIGDRKRAIYFFYIEIKCPDASSNYQEENDFVKLMKHIKHSVDQQIGLKIKKPMSFGLLCEVFQCFLFRMMLVEDGVYLPVFIRKFKLVEDISDVISPQLLKACPL